MNKTKIDWAEMSWNPVTGCLHKCEYCYARKIASRFGKFCRIDQVNIKTVGSGQHTCVEVEYKQDTPYPEMFTPTLHKYRLSEPAQKTKPQNIFVCSMADLFGEWVPDSWIQAVFKACEAAPQHRYLFLTKNPERYCKLADAGKLPELDNFWYGSTITKPGECMFAGSIHWNTFLSIEPLLAPLDVGIGSFGGAKWIIVGAETGNRAGKVMPERAWVEKIIDAARLTGAAVFLKNSLLEVMEGEFIQEYPWEVQR